MNGGVTVIYFFCDGRLIRWFTGIPVAGGKGVPPQVSLLVIDRNLEAKTRIALRIALTDNLTRAYREDSTPTWLSVPHQVSKECEVVPYHPFWAFAMASKFSYSRGSPNCSLIPRAKPLILSHTRPTASQSNSSSSLNSPCL